MELSEIPGINHHIDESAMVSDELEDTNGFNAYQHKILQGSERILLVDDEKAIVKVLEQILKKLGYQVTSYTHSHKALEDFTNHPKNFDLVITDMVMPNITGDELCREMIKVRPDIPILICTGFSHKLSEEKARFLGIKGIISKPVRMKNFSIQIREALA